MPFFEDFTPAFTDSDTPLQWKIQTFSIYTLTLKQIFWKTKTFLKKQEYCSLVETTKIENTSFSFKTASEANAKIYK